MAWGPFSAEAVALNVEVQKLHRTGRISAALDVIHAALDRAHREGPSNKSYEEFERDCDQRNQNKDGE